MFPLIKEHIIGPFNQDRHQGIEQKEIIPLFSLESDKVFKDLK